MKKYAIAIGVVAVVVVAYLTGLLHGNRSAATVCLEQAAADTHAGYRMLTATNMSRWRPETDRMLLGASVRALSEEKELLENHLRLYHKRRGPYEVRRGSRKEQLERIDKLLAQWQAILKTNSVQSSTEQSTAR